MEGLIVLFLLVAAVTIVLASSGQGARRTSADSNSTGAAEVHGPGDSDGAGTFKIELNPGQNQICYELAVSNIATPNAAHIHVGAADKAGPARTTVEVTDTYKSKGHEA